MRILEDWLSFLSTAYEPVQLTFDVRQRKNRTEKFRLSPHDTEMEVELTIATIFFHFKLAKSCQLYRRSGVEV
jgi:hypothetical protein